MLLKKLISKETRYFVYLALAQIIFIISSLYLNYKIENIWEVEGFALFNIIKRLGAFIVFILVLGSGIGIPRYISFIKNKSKRKAKEYLIAGLLIFGLMFFVFVIVLFTLPDFFLSALGNIKYSNNVLATIGLYIFSQGIFIIFSSYLRGVLKFKELCFLNILILSIIPVLLLSFSKNIIVYFWYVSLVSTICLIFLIISTIYKTQEYQIWRIKIKLNQLFRYGSPRVIGDMSLFSLDFLPIYLISVFISLPESGYLSLSLLFFKLISMPFELIGSLLIPTLGDIYKNKSKAVFVKKVEQLIIISVSVAVFISIGLCLLCPFLIQSFFSSMQESILGTQYILAFVPLYVVFLLLKNILDIIAVKAYNSWILGVSICVLLLALSFGIYKVSWFYFRVLPIILTYTFLGITSILLWIKLKKKI